jgi:hypothetical protein
MATTLERIHALVDQLPLDKQDQVLELIQELTSTGQTKPKLPRGATAADIRNLHFSMSKEEIDSMERAIMEDCERV